MMPETRVIRIAMSSSSRYFSGLVVTVDGRKKERCAQPGGLGFVGVWECSSPKGEEVFDPGLVDEASSRRQLDQEGCGEAVNILHVFLPRGG